MRLPVRQRMASRGTFPIYECREAIVLAGAIGGVLPVLRSTRGPRAVASWEPIAGEPARRIVGTTTEGMKMRLVRSVAPSALGAILLLAARPVWSDVTERASLDSTGALANAINIERFCPTLAADGRFVAFGSDATNLVTGDTNAVSDAFVDDRVTGPTERVSVSSAGAEANGTSFAPAISADGRFVAFPSEATNLVTRDTNGVTDVFVRDRLTGSTERVSVSSAGAEANGTSFAPAIAADGRFVAFASDATNLVGRDTNGAVDIFVHDRVTGATKRVSVASTGSQAK